MSHHYSVTLLTVASLLAPMRQAHAQAADSAARLNDAGQWQAAWVLVRSAAPSATGAAACDLNTEGLFALVRMGRYDDGAERLATLDPACVHRAAGAGHASSMPTIRNTLALADIPATGIDFSALAPFWSVIDALSRDTEPSEELWHSFFRTPGARLSFINIQPLRADLEAVARPSRRAQADSVIAAGGSDGTRYRHLRRVVALRPALARFVDSVRRALSTQPSVVLAAAYLPPHATDGHAPPLVTFSFFRDDAYSGRRGIVVDLLHAYDDPTNLPLLLAHEFHHSFVRYIERSDRLPGDSADAQLVNAFFNLRAEGIADQIDKPYPMAPVSASMQAYAATYNRAYADTPAILHSIDSLLVAMHPDSAAHRATGAQVNSLLFSSGHPNGAYMARTIVQTFRVDSLFSSIANPFAFPLIYAAAERARGHADPLSPGTRAVLSAFAKRYLKRSAR